ERLAATARLEEEIRARAQRAQSPSGQHAPRAEGGAVSAYAEPEPRGQPSRTQPVKGSNAFLVGGIATGVIALLLIGGGGLWWSMHKPKPESAALPAVASGAGQAASAPGPVVSASAPSAPEAPTTPQTVPASPQVISAPAPAVSKPAPLVRKPMPVPVAKPTQPAALERPSQPETFAPAAPPMHGTAPQRQVQPSAQAREEAPSPAPPQAPPKPMGRVEALRAGLAACQEKGNFFSRQLCIQETRWKYCGAPLSPDPLWGKIPECPNSGQQNNP
ncbi:MAG: zinc ribbon domain-containing protein, partial [Thiomonas sp.]|nr:zinc ribbon domain-containing protein [Thiomonas sp.]